MKTFTVGFVTILAGDDIHNVTCSAGLRVSPNHKHSSQLNLGEMGPGAYWKFIPFAPKCPPVIVGGNMVMDADPYVSRDRRNEVYLVKPSHSSDSILVRVNLKNHLKLPIQLTKIHEKVQIVMSGHSHDASVGMSFEDALVVIPPHRGIIVGFEHDPELMVVVNNGGQPAVVSMEDYVANFVPHLACA